MFILSSVPFISDIAFLIFVWSFLYGFYVFFQAIEYLIFIRITLNSLTNCLPPFHVVLLENCIVRSFGVCFFVFPFWLLLCTCFYVLGRSAKTLVQTFVRHCMCLTLVNLYGTISYPQLVTSSAGPGRVHKESGCTPRSALTSTRSWGGWAEVSELPKIYHSC